MLIKERVYQKYDRRAGEPLLAHGLILCIIKSDQSKVKLIGYMKSASADFIKKPGAKCPGFVMTLNRKGRG
jgi:hypothetical protein